MKRLFMVLILLAVSAVAHDHAMEGIATWYGTEPFLGNRTPSGIICDGRTPQAAHKTLPFGTVVEVTNVKNERKVRVIITDRGPFVSGRVLDLNPKWLMNDLCGKKCGMATVSLAVVSKVHSCTKFRCLSATFGKYLDENEIEKLGLTWPPR